MGLNSFSYAVGGSKGKFKGTNDCFRGQVNLREIYV